MKIVTTGAKYTDIDSYAGCIAYAELLNLQGVQAVAVGMGVLNTSITPTIRSWNAPYPSEYALAPDDEFILIDISDVKGFEDKVDPNRVVELIDHHTGFEEYWHKKLGSKAHIEFIGAACTLVYERWVAAGILDIMSQLSARLLVAGILDNTLNFKASVTTDRDRAAYAELMKIAGLPDDWPAQYFAECQTTILEDVSDAVINDRKILQFVQLPGISVMVGQIAIWDARLLEELHWATIQKAMASNGPDWLVNIISINEGKSYFMTENSSIKQWAEDVLGAQFEDSVAITNRLWLRKEIIKQDRQRLFTIANHAQKLQ